MEPNPEIPIIISAPFDQIVTSPGSLPFPCMECGIEVAIGLGGQKIIAEDGGRVMCLLCATLQIAAQEADGIESSLHIVGQSDPVDIPPQILPELRRLMGLE